METAQSDNVGSSPAPVLDDPTPASAFRLAAVDTATIGVAIVPTGIAFGVLTVQSGFAWWWAPIISSVIFAGSLEFLALGMLLALTPFPQLALTALLVNMRHIFYGLSFPIWLVRNPVARLYGIYTMTDEAFALASGIGARRLSGARLLWIEAFCQIFWIGGGLIGALAGSVIPSDLPGLQFIMTALFLVLAMDAWRDLRDVRTVLLAAACGTGAMLVVHDEMLLVGICVFVVCLLIRYVLAGRPTVDA